MNLKDAISEFRAKSGVTQGALADIAGVSRPTMSKAEKGQRIGTLATGKISKAIGIDYKDIKNDEGMYKNESDENPD